MIGLLILAAAIQADDAITWCRAADPQQHRLCQMREAGQFFGIPVEKRFVEFDLMTDRRVVVVYAFPLSAKPALERALHAHLPDAEERLNPWGHTEGTHVWTTRNRRYTLEADDGKMTVLVQALSAN